jgi:hypothetical protein
VRSGGREVPSFSIKTLEEARATLANIIDGQ